MTPVFREGFGLTLFAEGRLSEVVPPVCRAGLCQGYLTTEGLDPPAAFRLGQASEKVFFFRGEGIRGSRRGVCWLAVA
jgi:hypothetical protein